MIAIVAWSYNEHGLPAVAVRVDGATWSCSPCCYPGHPGEIEIVEVDMDDGSDLARIIADDLRMIEAPGHDCLPSPICPVCGREAESLSESMGNAVMAGMLGNEP